MSPFNTIPGLVPLNIYSGSTLLTTNVNLINFTGSGVTTTIGDFNDLTITMGEGTTVNTGSLLKTASFLNPNLTFTKGDGSTFNINLSTLVPTSASYALSSSYALTSSLAISASYAPVFPFTGSALITGSLTVTGSLTTNDSFLYTSSVFQTTLNTTGFKLINIASGSQSASIQISGNGTVGGAAYIDFLKVTNTASGSVDPNKSFRINNAGAWEVMNSAYDTIIFSLSNAGVLNTPGGGVSDRRTKDNINYIIEDATYIINQLQPAEFEFKNNLGVKRHGFIAQDILEIKPDLVLGDGSKENGTYGLDYDGILALTVKALQEANTKIDKLEKTIEELKNK